MGLVPRTLHLPHASPLKIPVVQNVGTYPHVPTLLSKEDISDKPSVVNAAEVPAQAEVTPPYHNPLLIAARTDH